MKDQEINIFKENKFHFQPVYKRYAASKEGEIFLTEDIQKSIVEVLNRLIFIQERRKFY